MRILFATTVRLVYTPCMNYYILHYPQVQVFGREVLGGDA